MAVELYLLIQKTRVGMLIRAGATNACHGGCAGRQHRVAEHAGVRTAATWPGSRGAMAGPIVSVQPGMGEPVLILTLVVIIIGGLGSIRGALLRRLIVGVVDTPGARVHAPPSCGTVRAASADAAGPALASMLFISSWRWCWR